MIKNRFLKIVRNTDRLSSAGVTHSQSVFVETDVSDLTRDSGFDILLVTDVNVLFSLDFDILSSTALQIVQ